MMTLLEVDSATVEFLNELATQRQMSLSALLQEFCHYYNTNQHYQAFFEHTNDAVLIVDMNLTFQEANPQVVHLLGYTPDELIGQSILTILAPEEHLAAHERIADLIDGQTFAPFERKFRRKDGSIAYGEINVTLVRDEAGTPQYFFSIIRDISKRKQAELTLQDSEAHFRLVFDLSQAGIAIADMTGRLTNVNPAFSRLLGYTHEELIGMNFREFSHVENLPEEELLIQQVLRQEIPYYRIDKQYITKSGDVKWVDITVSLHRDATSGQPIQFIGIVEDISARKNAEMALKESEERFRLIFENSDVGIALAAHDATVLAANPAICRMLEYTQDELIGMNVSQFTHPAFLEVELALVERLLAREIDFYHLEKQYIAKSGRLIWAHLTLSLHWDNDQRYFIGIIEDISERKQAELALRESEATARALLQAPTDSIMLLDTDGKIIECNETMARRFNQPIDLLRGADAFAPLPPELRHQRWGAFQHVLQAKEVARFESESKGEWVDVVMYPIFDDLNEVSKVAIISRDITSLKAVEQERVAIQLEKEKSTILAEFIRDAAHEFRTPLATIENSVFLLEMDRANFADHQAKIHRQINKIVKLVETLVTMARVENLALTENAQVHLGSLLQGLVTAFSPVAQAVTIQTHFADDLPPIIGNAHDLRVAIGNLLDNAIRYTPAGGTITLRSERYGSDHVRIEVADTGIGMSPTTLSHIFERFYREDRAHTTSGFGLGLSIAEAIIHFHHGSIEVTSELGVGSTFTVILPIQ